MMMRGKKKVKKYQKGGVSTVIGPKGPTNEQRAASSPMQYGGPNAKGIGFGHSPNPKYNPAVETAVKQYYAQKQARGVGGGGPSIMDRFRNLLRGSKSKMQDPEEEIKELGLKKGGMIKSKSKKYGKGGKIDGCAVRGKTRGQMR